MWKKPEVVAEELKALVLARGTISQACNATSINRQQFNKYLAGQVLPGARNMRKICSYLGVSEEGLISEGPSLLPGDFVAQSENDLGAIAPGVGDLLKTAQRNISAGLSANVLPNGYYDGYFPLNGDNGMLVRWLLSVKPGEHGQTFTVRTYFCNERLGDTLVARTKFHGTVLDRPREVYLVATSRLPLYHPGVISVSTTPVGGRRYFTGLALSCGMCGPVAARVTLHVRGERIPARDALAGIGHIEAGDPDLDPIIANLMQTTPVATARL